MAKTGRPQIPINWDEFDKLVSYQCSQLEVAAFFDCCVDTLDRALQRDRGLTLADVWHKRKLVGKVRLRKAQFAIVERMGPGAAAMAIWLDKKLNPDENPDRPQALLPDPAVFQMRDVGTRTFEEFCAQAGYFRPFEKQEEMRAFGMDETETRLLLGARGYGKTDFVTIMGTAYDLYLAWKRGLDMSEHTNLIITKSKARNGAILEEIGSALEKNGVPLDKSNSSVIRVAGLIGQDHSVEAITIKTSMRGRHPKRIVMDDPVTDEDTSEAMRAVVKKRYDEAYKLCKNIVIIGQPAHFDDLYAHLRDVIRTMTVPHGSIPELDADLEAMALAQVDPNSIEMSYHLRIPKGSSSIFGDIQYIDSLPDGQTVAFLDPSDGGDFTAISAIKGYMDGIAVEGAAWQKAWYHCLDDVVPFLQRLGVKKLCFETNKHGNQPIDQLRALLAPLGIGVVGRASVTNKHTTIVAAGSYSHLIHLSKKSSKVYTDQVTKYEYGSKYDDCPDSLARGMQWLGLLKSKK